MCQRDPCPKVLVPNNKRPQAGLLYLPLFNIYMYLKGGRKLHWDPDQQLLGEMSQFISFKDWEKGPSHLSQPLTEDSRDFYTK